jgi:hypothetical protein
MPLYTSNSDSKAWFVSWLLTLLLVLLSLGGYEYYLKRTGFLPSVESNVDLWSWNRHAVQNQGNVIALVGASRMQLGVDTEVMRTELDNYQIVPLAINGQYPMATLNALAQDESFNGLVLMSFMAQMLEPRYMEMQSANNLYFEKSFSFYLSFDAYLTAELKAHFRFLHPMLGLSDIVKAISQTGFPQPFYVSGQADTSVKGYYELTDVKILKNHFIQEKELNYQEQAIMSHQVWQKQIATMYQYIKAIQQRGGQVVLIRFPTDDRHWQLDEEYYPRSEFWDTLVSKYPGVKAIHFRDDTVLSSFSLPDSSHLDQKDSAKFTLRLIQLLKLQQLL